MSRPAYIRGEPEERVVIEIGNREKDEIKMSDLLKKDKTIDHRKLMTWILEALRNQGLIRAGSALYLWRARKGSRSRR